MEFYENGNYTPDEINQLLEGDYSEYYRELWQEAVRCGSTEDGLYNWAEQVWEEEQQDYYAVFPGDWDHSGVDDFRKALEYLEENRPEDFKRFWGWWIERLDEESENAEDLLWLYHEDWNNDNTSDAWQTLGVFRMCGGGRCLTALEPMDLVLDPEALKIAQEAEKQDANN